jgi:hypothetical protein
MNSNLIKRGNPLLLMSLFVLLATPLCAQTTIEYVSLFGSDLNDGLTWSTAKRNIMSAYDALPSTGGTIYFSQGVSATSTPGCGIWILGVRDSAYKNPPPCWRKDKGVAFIGVADKTSQPNGHLPAAGILAGSIADKYHPAIWLSGESSSLLFSNLSFIAQPLRGVVIGEDSTTHSRTGAAYVAGASFYNVHGGAANLLGAGPGWDITGASFWIWLEHCGLQGTDVRNDPAGDLAPAVLLDGRTNTGVGLVTINDSNSSAGAIKFYVGANGGGVNINNLTSEGLLSPASVWFAKAANARVATQAIINHVTTADSPSNAFDVENDVTNRPPADILVLGVERVRGSMQILGMDTATDSPVAQQQEGIVNGRLVAQDDSARRGFGPVSVRFTNLAVLPSTGRGLTAGVAAPDGTTGAITFNPASLSELALYTTASKPNAGDWFVASTWMRANTENGFYSGNGPVFLEVLHSTLSGRNIGTSRAYCHPNWKGRGEWMWCYTLAKVVTPATGTTKFSIVTDKTHSISLYCPTLSRIPAGTISDAEVWEYAQSLQPYAATCPVGTTCNCAGHRF